MRVTKRWRSTIGLGLFLAAAVGCVSWAVWDVNFKRSSGWKDGDGGASVGLPAVAGQSGGRSLWIFGDTFAWNGPSGSWSGIQPDSAPASSAPQHEFMINGNTIGVSTWTNSKSDTNTTFQFYARKAASASTSCGTVGSKWNTLCPIANISGNLDHALADSSLYAAAGGFIPRDVTNANPPHFNWPGDGVYVENPSANLPSSYKLAAPFTSKTEKFLAVGYIRATGSGFGFQFVSHGFNIVTGVDNGDPSAWTYKGVTVEVPQDTSGMGLLWGNALVHVPGDDKIRIYGEIRRSTGALDVQKDMVLAVAWPSLDIAKPDKWWYAYEGNATTGSPCPSASPCYSQTQPTSSNGRIPALRHVAENIAGDFSVDYICHNEAGQNGNASVNACSFVLVHGGSYVTGGTAPAAAPCGAPIGLSNPRWVFARSTEDDMRWPKSQNISESATRSGRVQDIIIDPDWDQKVLCGMNEGREVRQIRAHDDISQDGWLVFSWYVGTDCTFGQCTRHLASELFEDGTAAADQIEKNRKAELRFGQFPLSYLRPWCTATGTCP